MVFSFIFYLGLINVKMSYDIKLFWKKDEKGVNVTVTTGEEDEDIVLDLKSKLNGFSYKKGFIEK